MTTETYEIRVREDGSRVVSRNLNETADSADRASRSMNLLGDAMKSLAVYATAKAIIGMADAVTTLNNQLKLSTGSATAAASAYKDLFAIAQRGRVSFTELGTTFAALNRAGKEIGVSQQRMLTITESVANAMAVGGGSAESMKAALVQLGQGMASGVLRGEELNSVMEQTPRLAKAIADGLNIPIGKLREWGSEGKLTSDMVIRALESQSAVLKGEVAGSVMTVSQAWVTLNNATTVAVGQFDAATGFSKALATAVTAIGTAITATGKAFEDNAVIIKTVFGALAGAAALATLAAIPVAIAAIKTAVVALAVVLAANPVVLALLGIGAVVGGVLAYNAATEKTVDGIKRTIAELEKLNATGPGIYNRSAKDMEQYNAATEKRKQQIKELRQELVLLESPKVDTTAEDARLARNSQMIKQQAADAEAANKLRLKISGVPANYVEEMNEVIRLNQSGALVGKEYDDVIKKMQETLLKKTEGTKKVNAEEKKLQTTYEALMGQLRDRQAVYSAEGEAQRKMTEAEQFREKVLVSLNNELKKLSETQKAGIKTALDTLVTQERNNGMRELEERLLGKVEQAGAGYYDQLKQIEDAAARGYDPEKIERMREALEATTPAAQKLAAAMAAFQQAQDGMAKSARSWQDNIAQMAAENAAMRGGLQDRSVDEQKMVTAEYQKQKELTQIENTLREKTASAQERLKKSMAEAGPNLTSAGAAEMKTQTDSAIANYERIANLDRQAVTDNTFLKLLSGYIKDVDADAGRAADKLAQLAEASGNISFANGIASLNTLVKSMDELFSKQKAFDKLRKDAGDDQEAIAKINEKQAQSTIKGYGDIAGAMKGFFKEGSKGYKALQTAEKVFRAFEMAMALKSAAVRIAQEIGVTTARVTGDATATASAVTSSATIVAAKGAEASASAVAAVANQGTGDPYTAFPRIAAMIAIMAGIGLLVGGGGGGSGVQPSNQGTGTVFGDKDAKSASINNSLSLLEDVNTLTMQYSAQMAKSLRNIESALTGVTNIILRSNGMALSAAGVKEGTTIAEGKLFLAGIGGIVKSLPIIGKLLSALFGTKTTITGQGVMANDASLQQIAAGGLSAGYYTDVNKKSKFLGITVSDKDSTQFDESSELSRQFSAVINGFVESIRSAAPILGVSLAQIDANLEGFIVKIGKIDLKDLKGDEIKEKLLAVFGAAGDDIAMQALKGFEKYQEAGEGYLETVVRVAMTVERARGAVDSLNSTMSLTVDGAMELVEAFGGLEAFLQTTSSYLNGYFSDEERRDTLARQGSAALKTKGIDLSPDKVKDLTKDDIKKFVTSQEGDKDNYAWAQNFAVQMLPMFEYSEALEDNKDSATEAKDAVDELTKAYDDAVKTLKRSIGDTQIALMRANGNEAGARAAEKSRFFAEIEVHGPLDPVRKKYLESLYDEKVRLDDLLTERNKVKALEDESVQLQIQLAQAVGDTATATALLTRGMGEAELAQYKLNQGLKTQLEVLQLIPQVAGMYATPEQTNAAGYANAQGLLKKGGLDVSIGQLMALSKDDIAKFVVAVFGDISVDSQKYLLQAAQALGTVKDAAKQLADGKLDAAWAKFEKAYDDEKQRLEKSIDTLKGVFDFLESSAKDLYQSVQTTSDQAAKAARKFIADAAATARAGGVLPEDKAMREAVASINSNFDENLYATQAEADRDRLILAGQLSDLQDAAGVQLSVEEQALKKLEETYDTQLAAYENAKRHLDATYEGNATLVTIESAIAGLSAAIAGAMGAGGGAGVRPGATGAAKGTPWAAAGQQAGANWVVNDTNTYGYDKSTQDLYNGAGTSWSQELLRAEGEKFLTSGQDEALYGILKGGGFSLAEWDNVLGLGAGSAEAWARANGLDVFHRGTPYVPSTGLALLQQGEAVYSRDTNPFTGGGSGSVIQMLLERIAYAIEEQGVQLDTIAETNKTMSDGQDDYTEQGNGARTVIMNVDELAAAIVAALP